MHDFLHVLPNVGIGIFYVFMPLSGLWGRVKLAAVNYVRAFIGCCGVGHFMVAALFLWDFVPLTVVTGWHFVTLFVTGVCNVHLRRNDLVITVVHKSVLEHGALR